MLKNFAQIIVAPSENSTVRLSQRIIGNKMHLDLNLATNEKGKRYFISMKAHFYLFKTVHTFKNGSALMICVSKLFRNSSGSFSSHVKPVTELNLSNSCRNFITRSARTNKFFRRGFTISSLSTFCTSP